MHNGKGAINTVDLSSDEWSVSPITLPSSRSLYIETNSGVFHIYHQPYINKTDGREETIYFIFDQNDNLANIDDEEKIKIISAYKKWHDGLDPYMPRLYSQNQHIKNLKNVARAARRISEEHSFLSLAGLINNEAKSVVRLGGGLLSIVIQAGASIVGFGSDLGNLHAEKILEYSALDIEADFQTNLANYRDEIIDNYKFLGGSLENNFYYFGLDIYQTANDLFEDQVHTGKYAGYDYFVGSMLFETEITLSQQIVFLEKVYDDGLGLKKSNPINYKDLDVAARRAALLHVKFYAAMSMARKFSFPDKSTVTAGTSEVLDFLKIKFNVDDAFDGFTWVFVDPDNKAEKLYVDFNAELEKFQDLKQNAKTILSKYKEFPPYIEYEGIVEQRQAEIIARDYDLEYRDVYVGVNAAPRPAMSQEVFNAAVSNKIFIRACINNKNQVNVSKAGFFPGLCTYIHPANGINYGHISQWNTSDVTNMSKAFSGKANFNQDISGWNTSNVTDMSEMFLYATAFNQNISNWNTAQVTDMNSMFLGAAKFNKDISEWDTSRVKDMTEMFAEARTFDQNIRPWRVKSDTKLQNMFNKAPAMQAQFGSEQGYGL